MDVGGSVATGYERVREAFADGQSHDEGGAQLAVYRHGKKVVDIWAGRDREKNRPYGERTISMMMSCTKGAVAVCANMLSERGLLDFDAPVTRYWPEFGGGGKDMPVSYLMAHKAGLMGFDADSGITSADLLDMPKCVKQLEGMTPLWKPGTAYAYHFVTYGYLVGEVIRRVTGKTAGRFLAEEVAKPLGLSMWIGLPESEEDRVAPHFRDAPSPTAEQWQMLFRAGGIELNDRLTKSLIHTFTTVDALIPSMISRHAHSVELPAGNGICDARSLAKMYAATIGEVDGIRLFSTKTMERARTCLTDGVGLPGPMAVFSNNREPQHFGLGFELPRHAEPMLGSGSFGHAGAGGRMGFAHPESGFAVGYMCNNMLWDGALGPDARWVGWTQALNELI